LWIGLSAGLISIGCVLAVAWRRRVEWLRRELGASGITPAAASDDSDHLIQQL
jgi:hypothetical protein